jgi:hypothetical protein
MSLAETLLESAGSFYATISSLPPVVSSLSSTAPHLCNTRACTDDFVLGVPLVFGTLEEDVPATPLSEPSALILLRSGHPLFGPR